MSMDKSAIQEISANAIAAADAFNKAIQNSLDGTIPALALPQNFQLVDLERYLPTRVRARHTFNTNQIHEFIGFCPEDEPFKVFIDDSSLSATAIFNMGTKDAPGHCDHKALLTLKKTAPYSALLSISGVQMDQRTLAEWMEDWRDYIICLENIDNCVQIDIVKAIASIRKMTVAAKSETQSAVGSFSSEKSDFEKIEAKGDALPSFIEFTCEPYQSLPMRIFTLRLSVHINTNDVRFVLRIIKQEQNAQEMAQELAHEINSGLGDRQATVHVGTLLI